jgi:hypothetical protein
MKKDIFLCLRLPTIGCQTTKAVKNLLSVGGGMI